jgi:hypothetical protein
MHLNQYIGDLMAKYGIADSEKETTPESTETIDKADSEAVALLQRADKKKFQAVTGALMFVMTMCRPDLAHAVNMLSRRMSCPRACDLKAALRALRYLNGTRRLGLLFKYEDEKNEGLIAYADSDWANDLVERLSASGYVVLLHGTPISWSSGLQSVVALSSCEAEYVALSECCRELAYLRQLMAFLREPVKGPITIYEDNKGAIDLTNNPVHHKRTKHIDVKYHYIRVEQTSGRVDVTKIHTDDNRADIMTKATSAATFKRHVDALMFFAGELPAAAE